MEHSLFVECIINVLILFIIYCNLLSLNISIYPPTGILSTVTDVDTLQFFFQAELLIIVYTGLLARECMKIGFLGPT